MSAREKNYRVTEQRSSLGDWRSAVVARRSLLGISKTHYALLTLLTYPLQNGFWYQVGPLEKRATEQQSSDRRSEIGDRRSSLVAWHIALALALARFLALDLTLTLARALALAHVPALALCSCSSLVCSFVRGLLPLTRRSE